MEAGEKELRKAFEEVTTKNVKTVIEFSQDTRKAIRELEEKVRLLEEKDLDNQKKFKEINNQMRAIQMKLYTGGNINA